MPPAKKLRLAVIFGGRSTEHEVSLQSARNIVAALDTDRFDPVLIGIDKTGVWHLSDASNYLLHGADPALIALNRSNREIAVTPGKAQEQWLERRTGEILQQIDVVFPIVHGPLGEDGSLQGLLKMAGVPFVGSDVLGSAVCMDKDVTKRLLRDAGLPVTPYVTLTRRTAAGLSFDDIVAKLGSPLFVKPANLGSSVGVSKVGTANEYAQALETGFAFDHKILVESAVVGREIECAVMGNEAPVASACGEIVLGSDFYSYDSKYIDAEAAQVVAPAVIDAPTSERIRAAAVAAFQVLECRGLARVDFFLRPDGAILINEVNTLPGFTQISMFPKLWQAAGMTYPELVTRLIDLAIERHREDAALKRSR
ncbi:D-alanine--D-alanine ligase [Robbsia sp. Bb-Pol-6]|uniref:D-alanine--D-alanine ligase n=1 Tax=Robbsia betulipollinis TaxID=2981849 RepID=A0ABT3ZT29_9BURK|nr:D-alanine--D-alanine ligase [Robbsia betulipollinis]MCY0389028.1 D-alanine--D-alanine ligase [Robbsia betulipollinis]